MNPQGQRIAIAEACPDVFRVIDGKVYWKNDGGLCDLLSDLNAMHEAEKMLKEENLGSFLKHLALTTGAGIHSSPGLYTMKMLQATAAQRAEAFLKTIGKWKQ